MYRTTNMFEKKKKEKKKSRHKRTAFFWYPILLSSLGGYALQHCADQLLLQICSVVFISFFFLLLYICCTPHSTCFFFLFYNPHIELRQLHAPPSLIDVSFFTLLSKCLPCKSCNGRSHRSRRKDASAVHVARKKKKACQSHRLPWQPPLMLLLLLFFFTLNPVLVPWGRSACEVVTNEALEVHPSHVSMCNSTHTKKKKTHEKQQEPTIHDCEQGSC